MIQVEELVLQDRFYKEFFGGGVGDTFLCCCSDDFLKVTPKLVSYQQLMVIFSDRLTALRYLGNLRVEASRSLQNILPSKCLAF